MHFEDLERKLFTDRPLPYPGAFLIANPFLADPNFRRTVVLLLEHGPLGSMGLVVNKPIAMTLREATQGSLDLDHDLYYGGPVQTDTLYYLHSLPPGPQSHPVLPGLCWGGSLEELCEHLDFGQPESWHIRFMVGYSGWGPGQLQAEWEERSWLVVAAQAADIYAQPESALYSQLLRRLGVTGALYANVPEDPRSN